MKKSKKHQHRCKSKKEYRQLLSAFNFASNLNFESYPFVRGSRGKYIPNRGTIRYK